MLYTHDETQTFLNTDANAVYDDGKSNSENDNVHIEVNKRTRTSKRRHNQSPLDLEKSS